MSMAANGISARSLFSVLFFSAQRILGKGDFMVAHEETRGLVPTSKRGLAFYQRIVDPLRAIKEMGKSIAMCSFSGCSSIADGEVIAMEMLARGVTLTTLKKQSHITKYGLMDQAAFILAVFRKAGGRVKELSRTGELAKGVFSYEGDSYEVSLSWDAALKEPWVYEGKEKDVLALLAAKKKPVIKAKYQTPIARMQMLWWRLITDTIKAHWSEFTNGMPTIEEMGDMIDDGLDTDPSVIEGEFEHIAEARQAAAEEMEAAARKADREAGDPNSQHEPIVSAPHATVDPAPPLPEETAKPETKPEAKSAEPEYCSAEQSQKIRDLFSSLNLPADKVAAVLKSLGANNVRSLTVENAATLIGKLEAKVQAASVANAKPLPTESVLGPCTADQTEVAYKLLKEMEQVKPGSIQKFRDKLKADGRLTKEGVPALSALSRRDMEALIADLHIRNMDNFFARSLESWEPAETAGATPKN